MEKEKVLYICGRNNSPSKECSEWYKSIKSALAHNISIEENRIETPYAIIEFVHRRPLFTRKYDFVLKADKQDNDVTLFVLAIGKDY